MPIAVQFAIYCNVKGRQLVCKMRLFALCQRIFQFVLIVETYRFSRVPE